MTPGLRFPADPDPRISLVMVVYGGYSMARATIERLADLAEDSCELIVVDNASPDRAGARLQETVTGARFVMNDRNLGYGTAVNVGAAQAKGELLVVLNPDIEPRDGWLKALVGALDTDSRAAAATPLYLHTNGNVQEAGVLVGSTGTGYGYGDRLQAGSPELRFRRYVDYGSAAALLVRRSAFEAVGGFDPVYGLGYFEDADVCFALRELGHLTVFEPRAVVVHHGQGSFSHRSRVALHAANRPRFVDRFASQLTGRPALHRPPYDPHKEIVVRDWWAPQRSLVLDSGGALGSLADDVQALRPLDRVTHVVRGGTTGPGARNPFVETLTGVADLPGWLESRRYHYGLVVHDGSLGPELPGWLQATQPQAFHVAVDAIPSGPDSAARLLAAFGARPGHGWGP